MDTTVNGRTSVGNESYAAAKYRAQGLLSTEQETIYSTRVPDVIETKLLEETSVKEVTKQYSYNTGGSGGSTSDHGGGNGNDNDWDNDGVKNWNDYRN